MRRTSIRVAGKHMGSTETLAVRAVAGLAVKVPFQIYVGSVGNETRRLGPFLNSSGQYRSLLPGVQLAS